MNKPILITGGAGFVGTNLAHAILSGGHTVLIFDNLSRAGVRRNLEWLRATHGERVQVEIADVRDGAAVLRGVARAGQVYHLAAQVAVTTSLAAPMDDFETNVRGTLNVLEAARAVDEPPPLVFTSTNKVYGGLDDVPLCRNGTRYEPAEASVRARGIGVSRHLDFHSPYGCSKGAADQYVIDYSRTFGLPTVVFRMSCIYGPHQCGTEDQGWVAHFVLRTLHGEPITLFGDGRQVRDVLFVEDLVEALLLAQRNMHRIAGRAFNIGGGPANTVSLLELLDMIGALHGVRPAIGFDHWRPGDQRYYATDISAFKAATGWEPRTGVREGLARLYHWLNTAAARAANGTSVPMANGHMSLPPVATLQAIAEARE